MLRPPISTGQWPPVHCSPSEPTTARFYQVTRDTLRKAVGALADEGRLVVVRGKGTYVT
jgi:DNA-binding GntR family transcriptional regulator